jgi:hypothetical protein
MKSKQGLNTILWPLNTQIVVVAAAAGESIKEKKYIYISTFILSSTPAALPLALREKADIYFSPRQ